MHLNKVILGDSDRLNIILQINGSYIVMGKLCVRLTLIIYKLRYLIIRKLIINLKMKCNSGVVS